MPNGSAARRFIDTLRLNISLRTLSSVHGVDDHRPCAAWRGELARSVPCTDHPRPGCSVALADPK
jgi:hypothetical protein